MKNIFHQEVTNLFNSVFKKHNIPLSIQNYVDLNIDLHDRTIKWNRTEVQKLLAKDKISDYLEQHLFQTVNVQNKTFYHFLPNRRYYDSIINTGKIRLYNLEKYNTTGNDINEYSLFLKKNKIKLPGGSNQISRIKDNIFILCLTDLPSEKHWQNYANNGEGVMASFQFKKMSDTSRIIDVVKVCYEIPFLEELVTKLKQDFDMQLDIKYPLFAKHYKDKTNYSWENETRLSIDMNHIEPHKVMESSFGIKHDYSDTLYELALVKIEDKTKYSFIEIPIKNALFECTVNEIDRSEFDQLLTE